MPALPWSKFWKYCVVGLTGTAVDFGVLLLLVEVAHWSVLPANTLSFLLAATNNYVLNKYWTYADPERSIGKQYVKFLLVSTVGLGLNTVLMSLLVSFGMWYVAAKVIVIGAVLVWNFAANSLWTFQKPIGPIGSPETL